METYNIISTSESIDFRKCLNELNELNKREMDLFHEYLKTEINSPISAVEKAIEHMLCDTGKKIRPNLLFLIGKMLNIDTDCIIRLAISIELIHTASLMHDDVLDTTTKRRNKQTCNDIWGNKMAIMMGDFLFISAIKFCESVDQEVLFKLFSKTTQEMLEGNLHEITNENNLSLPVDDYITIIRKKTSSLFACACMSPSMLNCSTQKYKSGLEDFGYNFGNIFQLIDDNIDYFGNTELTGKNICTDFKEGKTTLPLITCLERCNEKEEGFIKEHFGNQDISLETCGQVVDILSKYGSWDVSNKLAEEYYEEAIKHLSELPDCYETEILRTLTYSSLKRIH